MRTQRGFHISGSRRSLALGAAALIVVCALVPLFAQPSQAGARKVIAVRELELKAGVDPGQFEKFAQATYNPGWNAVVPGLEAYIGKGDRGALKGGYALVLIFESEKTRDAIFPKEGGGASPAFAEKLKGAFALNQELEKFLEPGGLSVYTDYVAMR